MLARKMSGAHREAARLKLALDKAVAQSLWSTASDLLDVIAALSVNRELLRQTEIGLSVGRARKLKSQECHAVAAKAKALIKRWKSVISPEPSSSSSSSSSSSASCPRNNRETIKIRLRLPPQPEPEPEPEPQHRPTARPFPAPAAAPPPAARGHNIAVSGARASSSSGTSNGLRNTVRLKLSKVLAVHAAEYFNGDDAGNGSGGGAPDADAGARAEQVAAAIETAACQKYDPLGAPAATYRAQEGLGQGAAARATAVASQSGGKQQYQDKVRQLLANLRRNRELACALLGGYLAPEALLELSVHELANAEQRAVKEARKQKVKDMARTGDDWTEEHRKEILAACNMKSDVGLFMCFKCKSTRTENYQKQTRCADEPMTVFVRCLKCGNRWRC